MVTRSIISSADGMIPCAITSETAWLAVSIVGKAAIRVEIASGVGSSLTLILVIVQSVPSDPTSRPSRSSPCRSSESPPTQLTLPSARTTSMPRTWLVVTP